MSHDPSKREANRRKHKIDLTDAYEAFDSPMVAREDVRKDYGEQRFVSLGMAKANVVVLVWVDGDDEPRLISCRRADPHEEEAYYRAYPQI